MQAKLLQLSYGDAMMDSSLTSCGEMAGIPPTNERLAYTKVTDITFNQQCDLGRVESHGDRHMVTDMEQHILHCRCSTVVS